MVIDTSAVVAALAEADADTYLAAIEAPGPVRMSAVNVYETRIVLSGRQDGRNRFDKEMLARFAELVRLRPIELVAFDADQALLAHAAYLRYGRGFHPAGLNMGDCTAYALAQLRGEPLLFKGDDFARTDIRRALTRADPNC